MGGSRERQMVPFCGHLCVGVGVGRFLRMGSQTYLKPSPVPMSAVSDYPLGAEVVPATHSPQTAQPIRWPVRATCWGHIPSGVVHAWVMQIVTFSRSGPGWLLLLSPSLGLMLYVSRAIIFTKRASPNHRFRPGTATGLLSKALALYAESTPREL